MKFNALRRGLLGAGIAGGAFAVGAAVSSFSGNRRATGIAATGEDVRALARDKRLPNVELITQDGQKVRFYDDVVKDRKAVISVMYTICDNICTPATRNLMDARALLADAGRDVHFVSLSLTPLSDTPAELRAYKAQFGIDDRWTFLTGTPENVERVQRALGFLTDDEGDDLLSHAGSAVLVDEPRVRWGHANTLIPGRSIARMIRYELMG
jgi:protein SCO1